MRNRFEQWDSVLPIAIRADKVVRVMDLPIDLTPTEADKIARVVKAMVQEKGQNDG